jgi:hypothetical protein
MFMFVLAHLAIGMQLLAVGYVILRTVRDRGAGW